MPRKPHSRRLLTYCEISGSSDRALVNVWLAVRQTYSRFANT